jgi:hypothetical protein
MPLRYIPCPGPFLYSLFFLSAMKWVSSTCSYSHDIPPRLRPKVMLSVYLKLKPLKSWAKIILSPLRCLCQKCCHDKKTLGLMPAGFSAWWGLFSWLVDRQLSSHYMIIWPFLCTQAGNEGEREREREMSSLVSYPMTSFNLTHNFTDSISNTAILDFNIWGGHKHLVHSRRNWLLIHSWTKWIGNDEYFPSHRKRLRNKVLTCCLRQS